MIRRMKVGNECKDHRVFEKKGNNFPGGMLMIRKKGMGTYYQHECQGGTVGGGKMRGGGLTMSACTVWGVDPKERLLRVGGGNREKR